MEINPQNVSHRRPHLSVLVAAYNTVEYVSEALQSISNQSYKDFELVVIDDGSTDGTLDVLNSHAKKEPRMRLISRANKGLIETRNELLQAAEGDLIAWMDSDDISTPDRLARQVSALTSNKNLVCIGGFAQCIDPDGEKLNLERYPIHHPEILLAQMKGGGMRFPTTMARKAHAIKVGGFREPFKMGEDLDFLIRLSEIGEMMNIADTIYLYRQHPTSVCAQQKGNWLAYRDAILSLAVERQLTGKDRLQRGETLKLTLQPANSAVDKGGDAYLAWAKHAFDNGNISLTCRYIFNAIKKDPLNASVWKRCLKIFYYKYFSEKK